MRFRFIQQQGKCFSVRLLCAVMGVSRSGYYARCNRKTSAREVANQKLHQGIQHLFTWSRDTHGYRRIHASLVDQGMVCSRNRVARLVQRLRLLGR